MKKFLKLAFVPVLSVFMFLLTGVPAMAATATTNSNLFPDWLMNLLGLVGQNGICATQYVTARARLAFFLVMGALVLVSVAYSVVAAFKYITSQGEPGKIEEANKAIKAIFMGIAAMVVGIIGMIIVFVVFGAKPTAPTLTQTCISNAQSEGCQDCQDDLNGTKCQTCETDYTNACNNTSSAQSIDEIKGYFGGDTYCFTTSQNK